MAGSQTTSDVVPFSLNSYETALCIIPAPLDCIHIDRLREHYDKGYGKWPAHINLVYPFVAPENLARAQTCIEEYLANHPDSNRNLEIDLREAGYFEHRNNNTVFLREAQNDEVSEIQAMRVAILSALGHSENHANLHLTIGQTEDATESSREFLLAKARLIPRLNFRAGALAILIRKRSQDSLVSEHMRLWGTIEVDIQNVGYKPQKPEEWLLSTQRPVITGQDDAPNDAVESFDRTVQSGTTFQFDQSKQKWEPYNGDFSISNRPNTITVSTYNVLIDSEYPPARDRDPLLVETILSDAGAANILVLQEVSDDFLSFLLDNVEVQHRFPFVSHGPSHQLEIGPLPSLRNIVVLSVYPFSWKLVPFHRRHKGAIVAQFHHITNALDSGARDLVVAGVHLTCGLTDGSCAAKKIQLNNLTNYIMQNHGTQPWIVAGDFNITTSTYTIDMAVKNKSISPQTVNTLASMEQTLNDFGLLDAWTVARTESVDDVSGGAEALFPGEEGATFDPGNNELAAATSGTSNNRPQRYDRVLVRPQDTLQITKFNYFGLPQDVEGIRVASDHTGIRATIKLLDVIADETPIDQETMSAYTVCCTKVAGGMSDMVKYTEALTNGHMFTTAEEAQQRKQVFDLLKSIILGTDVTEGSRSTEIPIVFVAVGSYAMDVWTSTSDIDCLCIGAISSKTFFKLARQRILRDGSGCVRIMRKVEANTGTMLELYVNGIAVDLQYCPAGRVVERWHEFRNLPASDPIFNLPLLSLRKLKPYRDMLYIQRTLPSTSTFGLAYRCIKLWATRRGIYSSKFGYLSGTHITIMLSWIHKRIVHDAGPVTAMNLVATFFDHYANFDWSSDIVFDAFFHKKHPRYHRSTREPMVILGHHAPNSNIAHTATAPGLRTVVRELEAARQKMQEPGMQWSKFFGEPENSVTQFLTQHHSFAKIDIQFWGRTLSRGKSLVGWVESRCLGLVVDINRLLPELSVRIWPARFTDMTPDEDSERADYQGCYLIGLSKSPDTKSSTDKDARELMKQTLDKALDRFLTQLKTDEKNYDPSISWIGVSLARPSDVVHMRLDDKDWGDYAPEMEPDSDDEEEDIVEEDLDETDHYAPIQRTLPQRPKPTAAPLSASKLRPASDVLNRLRWDPSLDPSEYIIGYEDRFLGAKETGLEKWKTEQTDEEFIPQHRILYFKKKVVGDASGEIVWERATRIDRVFGSGVGGG